MQGQEELTAIVREDSRVASREIERPRDRSAKKDCCARLATVEIEPLFGLEMRIRKAAWKARSRMCVL